jgi:guanylate kinase
VTTRPMRPGEVDGRDYLFVDQARFREMVQRNELLEYATVFDNSYGTPRGPAEAALSAGYDVLFDIDWQGTQQLREKARADVVSAFILPPSVADLEKRLHSSAQYSPEAIRSRMSRATHELSHWAEYDYLVINQDIDAALAEVQSILKAERLKRERRLGLSRLIRTLESGGTLAPPLAVSAIPTGGFDGGFEGAFDGGAFQPIAFQSTATAQTDTTESRDSAFELLQARVALLEAALASRPPGMGHNRGPNIGDELSVDEAEIQTFISRLRDQRAAAPVDLPKLMEAAQVADPSVNKWRERSDVLLKGALKGAGFVAGKEITENLAQAAWVHSVYSALQSVFESLMQWLTFI